MPVAPLWLRWVAAAAVAAAMSVALVLFVRANNTEGPQPLNQAAAEEANRQAEIIVKQDQAPQTAALPPGARPRAALQAAIRGALARQVAHGAVPGPVTRSSCAAIGGESRRRRGFTCRVIAGAVAYPFLGVADLHTRRLTFCKRDIAPVASENVPVSRECRP